MEHCRYRPDMRRECAALFPMKLTSGASVVWQTPQSPQGNTWFYKRKPKYPRVQQETIALIMNSEWFGLQC